MRRAALPSRSSAERIPAVTAAHAVALRTRDGVALSALHWDTGRRQLGCVVAHGFTGSARAPDVQAICRALAADGIGVLAPDLRGHGGSGGHSTLGADEVLDIEASVEWLREQRYARVAALGWSMGGSAVLRFGGIRPGAADAIVSVSSPGRWFERGTRPMRIVQWLCETRSGRTAVRLLRRTRIDSAGWVDVPEAPHEVIGAVAAPMLIVHGDADHYFPLAHVELLRDAAPKAEVWIEVGMGHAENATSPELVARIATWLHTVTAETSAVAAREVCDDDGRD
jgi:pimeloyl-ACP methyl ester carboxylesterase